MKSVCWLFVCVSLALAGCQRGETGSEAAPPVAPPTGKYASDISKLCDCVKLSGAADDDSRTLTIANWLHANLETPESHAFLVQIQGLAPGTKATALETEARRVGLPGCALAAEWRTPAVN